MASVDLGCAKTISNLLESKLPANQMMQQVVDLLLKHGLAHYESGVRPSQVLCHPPQQSPPNAVMAGLLAEGGPDAPGWDETPTPQ